MASHTPHMICILVIKYTSLPIYIFGVFILYCGFRPRRVKIDFLSQTTMTMVICLRQSSLPPKRPFSLSFSLVLRSQMWKYFLKFFLYLVEIIKQLLLLCISVIFLIIAHFDPKIDHCVLWCQRNLRKLQDIIWRWWVEAAAAAAASMQPPSRGNSENEASAHPKEHKTFNFSFYKLLGCSFISYHYFYFVAAAR